MKIVDPRLRAEVRAVEEGHHSFFLREAEGRSVYRVISDTEPGVQWFVTARVREGIFIFDCSCHAGKRNRLCKHSQLVARRLERENKAVLRGMTWIDPLYVLPDIDPFEGLV